MRQRLSDLSPKILLLLAGLLRLGFILFSGKLNETEYWEYGEIGKQLLAGHGYSFPFVDEHLHFLPEQFYPSALMPPGYVFFLLPFLLIKETLFRNLLLFSLQTALALLAMHLVYRWSEKRFQKPAALLIMLLQAFYPEMIYAVCTIGPTVWFHLLFAGLLFGISEKKHPVLIGIMTGILVLMRSEALLPAGLLLAETYFSGQKKAALMSALTLFFCLLPWLIRNQLQFGKPLLSASSGVNFFRGNNPGQLGDWPVQTKEMALQMQTIPANYEQQSDAIAMAAAMKWISENPADFILRLPEKLMRFWWLDWPDPRTHHWLYVLPWIFCLPAGIAGLWMKNFEGRRQLLLLFLSYTGIILIFFPQARYLTLVKFFWLIPTGLGFKVLWTTAFPGSKFLSSRP
jgi:hypothetical protein